MLDGGWESWVLEISSFQAELLTAMAPRVAVFLNLSQDHLERHPDLDTYFAAKERLFAFQTDADTAVLNADDPMVAATRTAARKRYFSISGPADASLEGDDLVLDGEPIMSFVQDAFERHSQCCKCSSRRPCGCCSRCADRPPWPLHWRLLNGLQHRHRTVHTEDGVRWIDDSKATNVGATLAALRGYPDDSLHLILGGQAKGQDFGVLVDEVRRAVTRLYVIGEDGPAIAEALAGTAPTEDCETLAEAVRRARHHRGVG